MAPATQDAEGTVDVTPSAATLRGLRRPTVPEWLQQLAAVAGADAALGAWGAAVAATGDHGMDLSVEQMGRTGRWIVENHPDAALRTAMCSGLLRLRVHQVLDAREAQPR